MHDERAIRNRCMLCAMCDAHCATRRQGLRQPGSASSWDKGTGVAVRDPRSPASPAGVRPNDQLLALPYDCRLLEAPVGSARRHRQAHVSPCEPPCVPLLPALVTGVCVRVVS